MKRLKCCESSNQRNSYSSVETYEQTDNDKSCCNWKKVSLITGIVILSILFLLFLLIWVVFPIVFMTSKPVQRFFMFININSPKNPEFDKPEKYGIDGVRNFYITVQDLDNSTLLSIGAWMISPENEINSTNELLRNIQGTISTSTIGEVLSTTNMPVLIYMHGVAANRAKPVKQYGVLRKHFLIISIDHRGYGDSGDNVELSELGIVSDTVQIYRWIRSTTNNEIFIWGHSLGSALNAHATRMLRNEHGIVPMGIVLESPFSTMRDEVYSNKITKYHRWLAYFNATFLDPLPKNGFKFESTSNVLHVDCPIMIMTAEDDNVIPYTLSKKLYEAASNQRTAQQGNVTYHQFPALGYMHNDILDDPNVDKYIEAFISECRMANKMRN